MILIVNRRLDKFRLLRRYTSALGYQLFIQTLAAANTFASAGELKKKKKDHRTIFWKRYKGSDESTGLSIVFFSVQKEPAISIEISPRKLSHDDLIDAKSFFVVLGLDNFWQTFKVASVEVAMDVRIPFKEMAFLAPGVKTSRTDYLSDGTLYIGSLTGRRRFRLYDKGKHLKDMKGIEIDHPLTRIEAVHQGLGIHLDELHTLENPFGRLLAVPVALIDDLTEKHPSDYEFAHFCMRMKQGLSGHDAYWELDQSARKRIAKYLRPLSLKLNGKEERWQAWIAQQQEKLKEQFQVIY